MITKLDILNRLYQLNQYSAASIEASYNSHNYNTRSSSELNELISQLPDDILFTTYLDEYENKIILVIQD